MRSHTHCTGNISANFTPHQLCWNEWNGNGYLMLKMQFGGCDVVGRSILKGVSFVQLPSSFSKLLVWAHAIFSKKEALQNMCAWVCWLLRNFGGLSCRKYAGDVYWASPLSIHSQVGARVKRWEPYNIMLFGWCTHNSTMMQYASP